MAESSIFWTTGSTGDGAAPYTQAQIIDWLRRTFINDPTVQGVLSGYGNELEPTGTTSPVTVDSGAAMVYGFPYDSTTPVTVAITTPSIGTTGHRIVLRANWTAQTVRIALLSSSDGVASIPALTQTPDTVWEISLASLVITTGGAITVTDTRQYVQPNFVLLDGSVTTAKLANDAVDDTKAGNRVLQFYRRQGGNTSAWNVGGTTTYTPGAVREEAGSYGMAFGASDLAVSHAVTYPVAFSAAPIVLVFCNFNGFAQYVETSSESASGFTVTVHIETALGASHTFPIVWLAIGPE